MKRKHHSALSLTAGNFFSALFVCCVLSLVFTPAAFAAEENQEPQKRELYQWKDDKGVFHITDDAGKIPEKYRSKAEKIESIKGTESEPPSESGGTNEVGTPSTSNEESEDLQRSMWLALLKEWRGKLANAELRLQELKLKREEALMRWGGSAASGRLEGRKEAEQIEQEMRTVQREIDEARRQIEVVIPDEARKAGIPPGWLRE
jgi:hypothetical protein